MQIMKLLRVLPPPPPPRWTFCCLVAEIFHFSTLGLAYSTLFSSPPVSTLVCFVLCSLSRLHFPPSAPSLFRRALVSHSYLQDAAGAGLSQFVDLAVAQGAVGTVLSTDAEDDAVFGFVTALPLRYLARENQCAQVCADDTHACLLESCYFGGWLVLVFFSHIHMAYVHT